MPTPTIKQLQKFYNDEILKDTTLSMDNIIEVTAGKAGIAAETVKDALIGNAKLTSEVLVKIFEALGLSVEAEDPCGPGMTPEKDGCVDTEAEHPCGPGETPERDGCGDTPAGPAPGEASKRVKLPETVKEQLESTFGKDDLGNHFAEVLKLIKETKDTETAKYLSEIFRKVFETIPHIIKAEQGDKITEYTKKVEELEKQIKKGSKQVEQLQAAMKKVPRLTEALSKIGSTKLGKGLYEQDPNTKQTKTNELTEMSIYDLKVREAIPNFD